MRKHIMIMGVTISSTSSNEGLENGFSDIPNYLKKTFEDYSNLIFSNLSMKNSRDITEEDMQNLLEEIRETEVNHIIVTHGTFTLMKTASWIKEKWQTTQRNKNKVVCFVGSEFSLDAYPTDALFNLGFVLGKVEKLTPKSNVYCYVNGQVFPME